MQRSNHLKRSQSIIANARGYALRVGKVSEQDHLGMWGPPWQQATVSGAVGVNARLVGADMLIPLPH